MFGLDDNPSDDTIMFYIFLLPLCSFVIKTTN